MEGLSKKDKGLMDMDNSVVIVVSRVVASLGKGGRWGKELSKKEKGLMDMDNSVVIVGGEQYKGTKW